MERRDTAVRIRPGGPDGLAVIVHVAASPTPRARAAGDPTALDTATDRQPSTGPRVQGHAVSGHRPGSARGELQPLPHGRPR